MNWLLIGVILFCVYHFLQTYHLKSSYLTPASRDGWYQPYYKSEPRVTDKYLIDPADRFVEYPAEQSKTGSIAQLFTIKNY